MSSVGRVLRLFSRAMARVRRELRRGYYRLVLHRIGEGCILCDGVLITMPERVSLGQRVYVNEWSLLQGSEGATIEIGNDVVLSYGCMVLTAGLELEAPPPYQAHNFGPVFIEDGAWVGARAIVLPGCRIGRCAVIGAGSVVTKDVSAGAVVAGNPASVVKQLRWTAQPSPRETMT